MEAFGGFFGLLILALNIWAIANVVRSSTDTGKKVLWILLILIMPVIGLIIWGFMGPRGINVDDRDRIS